MDNTQPSSKASVIKNVYFYLVSFVALMMVTFSLADIINIVLRTYVFKKADVAYFGYSKAYGCDPLMPREEKMRVLTEEECMKLEKQQREEMENNRIAEKQRSVVRDISMIVVGIPLFLLHWGVVRKKDDSVK